MITQDEKNNKGFIALMSAIIISIVLLLMITNLSLTGFYGRFNILDFELKEKSSALAEACADEAILNLTQNIDYTGDVNVGADKCSIRSITGSNIKKTIEVSADYKNYITNLEIDVDTNIAVTRWEEVPNF